MCPVSSCSWLWPIYWIQALSREWRCSWSSADRRCSNYIWVINNLLPTNVHLYHQLDGNLLGPYWVFRCTSAFKGPWLEPSLTQLCHEPLSGWLQLPLSKGIMFSPQCHRYNAMPCYLYTQQYQRKYKLQHSLTIKVSSKIQPYGTWRNLVN